MYGSAGPARRLELEEEEEKPAKRHRLQLGEDPEGRTQDANRVTPAAPGRQDGVSGRDQAAAGLGQVSKAAGDKDNETAAKVESEELQFLVRLGGSQEGLGTRLCLFDTQTFDTLIQSTMTLYTIYEATAKKLEFSSGKSCLATLF